MDDHRDYGEVVGLDNWRATYDLTKEVIARGHVRIAVVCGWGKHDMRARSPAR